MPLVNCISIVTDLYNIHYDGYYLKYDEIAHRKEVNFCRGAHSTNPCGICFSIAHLVTAAHQDYVLISWHQHKKSKNFPKKQGHKKCYVSRFVKL